MPNNSSPGKSYSFKFRDENYLLDSAFVNRKLVLTTLGDYVNSLNAIWKNFIEKKPTSVQWWAVSLLHLSTPKKSECQECLEKLGLVLGQLSQTVENAAQFKTYLDTFAQFALSKTNIFLGSPAQIEFAKLLAYLDQDLEKDLKRAQTNSIEIPEIQSDSTQSCSHS